MGGTRLPFGSRDLPFGSRDRLPFGSRDLDLIVFPLVVGIGMIDPSHVGFLLKFLRI
jgi:hypothetical protein